MLWYSKQREKRGEWKVGSPEGDQAVGRRYTFYSYQGRRLLRVPWTAGRSNQSILKEINPEYSLEVLMLKLKLCPPEMKSQLIGKNPDAGKD